MQLSPTRASQYTIHACSSWLRQCCCPGGVCMGVALVVWGWVLRVAFGCLVGPWGLGLARWLFFPFFHASPSERARLFHCVDIRFLIAWALPSPYGLPASCRLAWRVAVRVAWKFIDTVNHKHGSFSPGCSTDRSACSACSCLRATCPALSCLLNRWVGSYVWLVVTHYFSESVSHPEVVLVLL